MLNCCRALTDETGEAFLGVMHGKEYIIIGVLNETTDKHLGSSTDNITENETVRKYLQLLEVPAKAKQIPGKMKKVTGSELWIIEPEYIEWTSLTEYYPFVFETLDNWTTEVSVSPPEGYEPDHESLSENVTNEVETVMFTITEVGSKPGETYVVYKVWHNGKLQVIHSGIPAKETPAYQKAKGRGKGITGF